MHEDHRRRHGRRQCPRCHRPGRAGGTPAPTGVEILLVGRTEEILRAVEACGEKTLPAGVEIKGRHGGGGDRRRSRHGLQDEEGLLPHRGTEPAQRGSGGRLRLRRVHRRPALPGATLVVKRIRGIRRAAMGPTIPVLRRPGHFVRLRRQRRVHAGVSAAVRVSGQLLRPAGPWAWSAPGGPFEHRRRGGEGRRPPP